MIDGKTELYGLLGMPLSHSLSPKIHNRSAASLGLNKCYVPLPLQSENLEGVLKSLWDVGFQGLNVTVPLKEAIAAIFPESGLYSVNTLSRGPKGWDVSSTDGPGFLEGIRRKGCRLDEFQQVVCLGNGGAALSVLSEIAARNPQMPFLILRRSEAKDSRFRTVLSSANLTFLDFTPQILLKSLKSTRTLLIQATSAPLFGDDLSQFNDSLKSFEGFFVDMLYGKSQSALISACHSFQIPHMDGLDMLIGQAIESQKIWWGQSGKWDDIASWLA